MASIIVLLCSVLLFSNCGQFEKEESESARLSSNQTINTNDNENIGDNTDTSQDLGGFVNLPPVILEATFASINTNIIQEKCLGCHSEPQPSGNISFETYDQILSRVNLQTPGAGLIMQRSSATDATIMPPAPFLPLSLRELEVIEEWISLGAPNN